MIRLRKEVQRLKAMDKRVLSDAMLVSGHIADWLDGVVANMKPEYRELARPISKWIRAGDWRGQGKDKP